MDPPVGVGNGLSVGERTLPGDLVLLRNVVAAILMRAVFRLAYRQVEGLIDSIISLLGLTLRVPDHTTPSRRSATLAVPRPQPDRC
jgi:hypothetical protein